MKKKDKGDDDIPAYEFGLSLEELKNRTSKEYLGTKAFLKADGEEYKALKDGDKQALKHLLKAGLYLENVHYQIDDHHNLPFKKFLEDEIKKGNE